MNRYGLLIAGAILGCAGTVAVPVLERAFAQPYAANPAAPRWELVAVPAVTMGTSRVWSEIVLCYKRPAPR